MRPAHRRPLPLADASADGEEHDVSGVYREVIPNEKLVFTWAWKSTPERESLVTLTFKADGDGTVMTLRTSSSSMKTARDSHNQGWTSAMDKLDEYLTA